MTGRTPVPFTRPHFSATARRHIGAAIDGILSSGHLMLAEYTERLEHDMAAYIGTSTAVSTNSCTTALQMALLHHGVRGGEVLVPAAGFVTDISVVRWSGATPVLVDVDSETLALDVDDLRRKVTPCTRAIIWVHLTGIISPQWREIVAFARDRGLLLIEDCAHAHGASVEGRKAGSIGDVGCFSFYPTKVMTAGSGGIMTTNDAALDRTARELRLFGRRDGVGHVWAEGNDWFLDEVRACLAYFQLQELDAALTRRRTIAARYDEKLRGIDELRLLAPPQGSAPAYYHYTVFLKPGVDGRRLADALKEAHGVPTKPIYLPLHHEPVFRDLDDGTLRGAETMLQQSMCLPLFVGMTDEQVDYVADALISELPACRV